MQPPSFRYIQSGDAIAAFLESLRDERTFALDLEADSLHSYREKVCLVQISTPAANAILDPLPDKGAAGGLGTLLANSGIQKVLHGSDYDIRLLKKDYGFEVRSVFDTAIAAQFTGRSQFGLAALLEELFAVRLDKKYQRADWSERPLPPELLAYAALDTAYLLELKAKLEQELEALGRLGWVQEEFELLERITPAPAKTPWCLDVKGADRLTPRQLAVLQGMLEVRDHAAREWDRPAFKVISNSVLLTWAAKPPGSKREVIETPGANGKILTRLADPILEAVRRARALPPEECPILSRPCREPMDSVQEKRLKRLKQVRAQAAESLALPPGLLVNSATLERLARKPPDEAARCLDHQLKRWQFDVVGEELRKALNPT